MYAQFYGLSESPFALTPDPRYLFLSEPHKEALASAVYGVQERKGFVLILGEVGTGKTTIIRHLLGRFGPNIHSVFVFNPAVSFTELLQLMLRDLELPCASLRRVEMIDTLNDYLLKEAAAGRYVVVIIDEAQHLSPAVLEEVRMLSNLETARGKLIQILLVGQPELGEKLGRPELRQLRQRISLVAELKPLSYDDTVQYITHRLEVAGREGGGVFSRRALKAIYRGSGGIPRLVNVICDKALVLGYGAGAKVIKAKIIREVLKDWKPFQQRAASPSPHARPRAASLRRRADAGRPLRKIAAAVGVGLVGAALIGMLAVRKEGDVWSRIWHGLIPTGASGTVVDRAATVTPPDAVSSAAPRGESSAVPSAPTASTRESTATSGSAAAGAASAVSNSGSANGSSAVIAPGSTRAERSESGASAVSPSSAADSGAGEAATEAAGAAPALPPRVERRLPALSTAPGGPTSALDRPGTALAMPGERAGGARQVVVTPGDVFSALVAKNYGRAELTLIDFVKSANPDIGSIDVLHAGQRITLPAYEPGALVQPAGGERYRVHLLTTWDDKGSIVQKLGPAVAKLGRQIHVVPVSLTQQETAYRVLVGDFADRREAENFSRDFKMPRGVSSQQWR